MDTLTEQKNPEKTKPGFFKDTLRFVILAFLIVIPIRFFVAQPFVVSGASMDPTFNDGEYIIVDELSYRFDEPERGDPIIFKYPKDTSKYFIKRIIALPGETIRIIGTEIFIQNSENPEGFKLEENYIYPGNAKEDDISLTLKNDEYFVMGDNRRSSLDSRYWGPLPRKLIVGS